VPAAQAMIATTRPGRYLHQLCRHVDELSRHPHHAVHPGRSDPEHPAPGADTRVTWTDTGGVIDLGWSRCTLTADGEVLTLRAEADDATDLRRLQALLGARLEQFGRREHLTVVWQPARSVPVAATGGRSGAGKGRPHRRTVGLVVLGTLVVALHVALGAAAVAVPWWTSPALDVVVAVVVVKLLVSLVLGRRIVHRRRRPTAPP
jgi:hypothetical protein